MTRGVQISAGLHGLLVLWVLFGGAFRANPPEMTVADVTVLSEAEFAALTAPQNAPENPEPAPQQPSAPEPEPQPEPPAPEPRPAPEPTTPPTPPEPQPEPQPEPAAPQTPPPASVQETVPDLAQPEPTPPVTSPDISSRPVPRPAPRVAPEPVAPPPPDAAVDPEVQQAADPDAVSPDQAEEQQEQTAPEEAATEIVTEAERPASAPTSSMRPLARPDRLASATPEAPTPEPAPAPSQAESVAEATSDVEDDVNAALQDILGSGTPAPTADPGPPLTSGEREGLRLAVQECWVVDVGSQAANVTVTLGFDMAPDGTVQGDVRLLDSSGGAGAAVDTAFQAARRALLRCQQGGYDLPVEKYEQWKEIEMTFNPAQMRLR